MQVLGVEMRSSSHMESALPTEPPPKPQDICKVLPTWLPKQELNKDSNNRHIKEGQGKLTRPQS